MTAQWGGILRLAASIRHGTVKANFATLFADHVELRR